MVIYGGRSRRISVGEVYPNSHCDRCGKAALRPIVYQRYFHVYWIPFFPLQRHVIYGCAHCKTEIAPELASVQLQELAPKFASKASTPLYTLSGLLISATLIIGFVLAY